jgi:hypothetical protein
MALLFAIRTTIIIERHDTAVDVIVRSRSPCKEPQFLYSAGRSR